MTLQDSINNRAASDAGEYKEILAYVAERFGEDQKDAAERVAILAELVAENPDAASVSAEFLGITPRQFNVAMCVLGIAKPAWMDDVIADEVKRFDEAGEAIRVAVKAVCNRKGWNIAAARFDINLALERVADGRQSLADAAGELGIEAAVLEAYRDA